MWSGRWSQESPGGGVTLAPASSSPRAVLHQHRLAECTPSPCPWNCSQVIAGWPPLPRQEEESLRSWGGGSLVTWNGGGVPQRKSEVSGHESEDS